MSDRQVFRGCLAFPSGALEEALDRVADDTDELVMDILRGARVGDDLLVLSEDSFFPASLWHHWTGAVAELSAVAHAGLVACVYQGDGDEIEVFEASGEKPAALLAARSAPDWFALGESPLRFDVEGEGHTIELRPTQLAPNVQALRLDRSDEFFPDFDAPLGVAYFASDGARLYAVDAWRDDQLSALDLSAPSPALTLAVDADASAPRLVHHPGSEGCQVWRVEGREDVETPAGAFPGCLRVGVTEHFVPTDVRDYQDGAPPPEPTRRTLFFAPDRGLVRAVLPSGELGLAAPEALAAPADSEPRPALVFAILIALVVVGFVVWLLGLR